MQLIYISKRTELTFAPKAEPVAISLYDIVKSTGERKDAFRFTYQAEGCTKGRLYKCLSPTPSGCGPAWRCPRW